MWHAGKLSTGRATSAIPTPPRSRTSTREGGVGGKVEGGVGGKVEVGVGGKVEDGVGGKAKKVN